MKHLTVTLLLDHLHTIVTKSTKLLSINQIKNTNYQSILYLFNTLKHLDLKNYLYRLIIGAIFPRTIPNFSHINPPRRNTSLFHAPFVGRALFKASPEKRLLHSVHYLRRLAVFGTAIICWAQSPPVDDVPSIGLIGRAQFGLVPEGFPMSHRLAEKCCSRKSIFSDVWVYGCDFVCVGKIAA